MSTLAHYRQITGFLHASLEEARQAGTDQERFEAEMGAQHWQCIREDILREARCRFWTEVERCLPRIGTLEQQLLALPSVSRAAYRAKLRPDAAEEDFAVHLLTWADSAQPNHEDQQHEDQQHENNSLNEMEVRRRQSERTTEEHAP